MKVRHICIIGFLITCVYGCLPEGTRGDFFKSGIKTETDDFDNSASKSITLAMHDINLMMERSIKISKMNTNEGTRYVMKSYIYAAEWFFTKEIKFNIDGKFFDFISVGDRQKVMPYGYIQELSVFQINRSFLAELKNAASIKIRFYGKDSYMDATITPEDMQLLKSFLSDL
ncbi:MAG: hypothetical protein WCI11_09170 [Candidatus Methylumidiphilus sp.]